MFQVSQEDVRRYFASIWMHRQDGMLDKQQQRALAIILEHPEYHVILENLDRYLTHQWLPEEGYSNPFLHLSLHLSLQEQCAIDQPQGITFLAEEMVKKTGDRHQSEHMMMDALTEMIWQAQQNGQRFDVNLYITLLRKKLGLPQEDNLRLNPHEI